MGEWINKLWYIHAMGCYSAIKKNELLMPRTSRKALKGIMPSERSPSLRVSYPYVLKMTEL